MKQGYLASIRKLLAGKADEGERGAIEQMVAEHDRAYNVAMPLGQSARRHSCAEIAQDTLLVSHTSGGGTVSWSVVVRGEAVVQKRRTPEEALLAWMAHVHQGMDRGLTAAIMRMLEINAKPS